MFPRANKLLKLTKSSVRFCRQFWNANVSSNDQAVTLKHAASGEVLQFPSIWLRDNCQCSSCFSETLYSRLIPLQQFKGALLPTSVSCSKNESGEVCLEVKWPDNHESTFNLGWLREHSFNENAQHSWLRNNYQFEKVTWNTSNFKDILRYFSFDELLHSDTELLKWLLTLNREGIAIVEGIGTDESQLQRLTNRIGITKTTTYGKMYNVEAKKDATNAAYLATPLGLHTDLPYYDYIPSVNLLHFVKQSPKENEGTNQLVDGIEISRQLKSFDENMYVTLTNTPLEWTDRGRDGDYEFYHINRAPVICEDKDGNIVRLNVSQHQRDPHFCVSVKRANEWYVAMNWFVHLAHHPKNMSTLKMKEGDLLSFDNTRVLHGRSGFSTERKVAGMYMDWDIVNSKVRILLSKLKLKDVDEVYTKTSRQEYHKASI